MVGRRNWAILKATALCLALAPGMALAQQVDPAVELEAQTLLDAALKLMADKQYAPACRKLEVVVTKIPHASGARLGLARCYRGEGRLASAWSQYRQAETLARTAGQADRVTEASTSAAELAPLLGKLQIEVPDDVRSIPGLTVTLNGKVQEPATWGIPFPADAIEHEIAASAPGRKRWRTLIRVYDKKKPTDGAEPFRVIVQPLEVNKTILRIDSPPDVLDLRGITIRVNGEVIDPLYWQKGSDVQPGAHEIEVIAPGRERWQTRVVIKEGDSATVKLEPLKEIKSVNASSVSALRVGGVVAIGVGLVGGGIGATLGGLSISKNNESNDGHCDAQNRCDQTGFDLRKDAQSLQLGGLIAGVAGAVILAGGVTMVVASSPSRKRNTGGHFAPQAQLFIGPTTLGLRGTW